MNEQESYDERWHMAQDLLAVMLDGGNREATHARAIDLLDGVDWDYETAVALVSSPAPSDGPGSGTPRHGCC